jgi:hypothetical protein
MDIFDLKNNLETLNENLSNIIKNLKTNLEEKNNSLYLANEKNDSLQQTIKNLEKLNKNIQEKHQKLEGDYESSLRKWKSKKKNFRKEIMQKETLINNNLPIKDYTDLEMNSLNLILYDHDLHVVL